MSKDISAKYYQDNKERQQKQLVKDIKIFLKKIPKSNYGDMNNIKMKDETQRLVEYIKNYFRMRKNYPL